MKLKWLVPLLLVVSVGCATSESRRLVQGYDAYTYAVGRAQEAAEYGLLDAEEIARIEAWRSAVRAALDVWQTNYLSRTYQNSAGGVYEQSFRAALSEFRSEISKAVRNE